MVDREKVKQKMAGLLKQPVARLEDTTALSDLVTDSFLLVEMVIELQEEFGVRFVQEDLNHVKTVSDLTELFAAQAR